MQECMGKIEFMAKMSTPHLFLDNSNTGSHTAKSVSVSCLRVVRPRLKGGLVTEDTGNGYSIVQVCLRPNRTGIFSAVFDFHDVRQSSPTRRRSALSLTIASAKVLV